MSGNSGNSGNAGNADAIANTTAASAGWFFADRIDLPFVTVQSHGTYIAKQRLSPKSFPEQNWSADWFAWRVLLEFAATPWVEATKVDPYPTDPAVIDAEIDNLVKAAQNERADALDEILTQSNEFISYFLNLLTSTPGSYPKTTRLLHAASQVGLLAVMHWKGVYQRPRPTQLCPALLPPIAVPGHAAYPSGHSTQAHLIASVLAQVFLEVPGAAPLNADLTALADRIARNREIAGVHYPSDSAAGVKLAEAIQKHWNTLKPDTLYRTTVAEAAKEWAWL
nr:phosphatase PAP2 family protein [uncultured Rhodopila sp.]